MATPKGGSSFRAKQITKVFEEQVDAKKVPGYDLITLKMFSRLATFNRHPMDEGENNLLFFGSAALSRVEKYNKIDKATTFRGAHHFHFRPGFCFQGLS